MLPGGERGCLLRGGLVLGGRGVVSAPGGVWSRGVSALGGLVLGRGVWSQGGGIPACTEADPPPPVNRMTDRCKNITLATTSLRPVIRKPVSILLSYLSLQAWRANPPPQSSDIYWRTLQRSLCILLECILVTFMEFLDFFCRIINQT